MADRYYLQGPKRGTPDGFFNRSFVFDANIWLSINGPFPDKIPERARAYSNFYKSALEYNSKIFIPQIIACEFLNRSVLIQARTGGFDRECKIHQADGYSEWIKEGCDLLHSIVSDHERISDEFHALDLESCYAHAESGGLEFHDVLIMKLCRRNNHVLVTDDADYADEDVPIVTWNQRLT